MFEGVKEGRERRGGRNERGVRMYLMLHERERERTSVRKP